jgi:hypothetical protein
MKILVCFGLILAVILPLYNVKNKDLFLIENIKEIYTVENIDNKQQYIKRNAEDIDCLMTRNVEGLIIVFDCDNMKVIKNLKAHVIKIEKIEELVIYYCYCDLYPGFVYVDGKQVNVQIVERNNETIAGFPLILSGF